LFFKQKQKQKKKRTFYLLALHPEKQVPLMQEIREALADGKTPDYDAVKDMKYAKGVINESLRCPFFSSPKSN